eukprot:TRINITY_DN10825_c0_g1_i3.p1 TRINITY_DN10825_c0_g1~~TRINITY_DN10825_c0_g1_i3.p1  ORF type:complete len:293 (+),score=56.06 TRINITY_DN10825_c0_g1_i3:83-961(+)
MAKKADGSPMKIPKFEPNRITPRRNLFWRIVQAVRDLIEVLTLATGRFDTSSCLSRNSTTPKLEYNGKRTIATIPDFPLSDITEIKNTLRGYTVNDIFVSLWAGTIRRYLVHYNDPCLSDSSLLVRGQAPFSFPRKETPGRVKNDMVFVPFKFPVAENSVEDRLRAAHEEFENLKHSPKIWFIKFLGSALFALGLDKYAAKINLDQWHRMSWVFSNVPGPLEESWWFGEKLLSFKPYYCNLINQAIFFSFSGKVSLALVLDHGTVEGPDLLGRFFQDELEELKQFAKNKKVV